MKYSEARTTIKSGDVVAFRSSGFFTKIVELFTSSDYTHVGIVWEYQGRLFLLESVYPRVKVTVLSETTPFYHIPLYRPLSAEASNLAFSMIGKAKYSYLEAVKSFFSINNRKDSKWQCVEVVKSILEANGFKVFSKDTPEDLVLSLQKLGYIIRYIDKD